MFGIINAFKQQHNQWTGNGKILLPETEISHILSFSIHKEFGNYLYEKNNVSEFYNISLFICTHIYTDLYLFTLYLSLLI